GSKDRFTVQRVEPRYFRVQLERAAQLFFSTGIIPQHQSRRSKHDVGFRRVSVAQYSVDQYLTLVCLVISNVRRTQNVGERGLIRVRSFCRGQQIDHALEFTGSKVAVREQQASIPVRAIDFEELLEFRYCLRKHRSLVVSYREVKADRYVSGIDSKRSPI